LGDPALSSEKYQECPLLYRLPQWHRTVKPFA
jgi:hypothetical protein